MASLSELRSVSDAQALGNRLAATKASPGWVDVCKIIRDLEQEAIDTSVNFEGWDTEQIVILKARAQATREMRAQIFIRIEGAILQGAIVSSSNTAADAAGADQLRQQVLAGGRFDTRIPGTYETGE